VTCNVFAFLVNGTNSDERIKNLNDVQLIFESVHNVNKTFNSDSGVFKNTIEVNEANVLKILVAINFRDDIDETSDNIGCCAFTGGCGIVEDESLLLCVGSEHPLSKYFSSTLLDSHCCIEK